MSQEREDAVSRATSQDQSSFHGVGESPLSPVYPSNSRETAASVVSSGVADPVVKLFESYQNSLSSGLPDDASRVAFEDAFIAPSSPVAQHIDDMAWLVTPTLHESVTLVRRPQLQDRLGREASLHRAVRWPETLALNIVTQWHYTLTVAVIKVVKIDGHNHMVAVRRSVKRVYGTPTKAIFRHKEGRAEDTIDYPYIYFNVDDFEDTFGDIQLADGYGFAVLLTAGDSTDSNAAIFRGMLMYDVLMQRIIGKFKANKRVPTHEQREFIPLMGPRKEGRAEVAVCISEADILASQNSQGMFSPEGPTSTSPSSPATLRGSTRNSNDAEKNNKSFLAKKTGGLLDKVTSAFSGPKPICEVVGDEILQCCLTFVSVDVNHVLVVLASREPIRRQWLHVPESRDELDRLLEHQRDLEEREAASSSRMSPASSAGGLQSREGSSATGATGGDGDGAAKADSTPKKRLGVFDAFRRRFGGGGGNSSPSST